VSSVPSFLEPKRELGRAAAAAAAASLLDAGKVRLVVDLSTRVRLFPLSDGRSLNGCFLWIDGKVGADKDAILVVEILTTGMALMDIWKKNKDVVKK